jgi:hypothetical protein
MEDLGSSHLSFFSLSPIIISRFPHHHHQHHYLHLHHLTVSFGQGIALTPWRLAHTTYNNNIIIFFPPFNLFFLFFHFIVATYSFYFLHFPLLTFNSMPGYER